MYVRILIVTAEDLVNNATYNLVIEGKKQEGVERSSNSHSLWWQIFRLHGQGIMYKGKCASS